MQNNTHVKSSTHPLSRIAGVASARPEHFAALEPRQLLAAFASVGFEFDPTGQHIAAAAYAVEGNISDNNVASGDMYFATTTGRTKVSGLPYASITKNTDGTYTRTPNNGYRGKPLGANGAQFLTADRSPAGWWFGDFGTNASDMEFIVERAANSAIADLSGSWRFSMTTANENTDHYTNGSGTMAVTNSSIVWTATDGAVPYNGSTISTSSTDGRFVTTSGEYFYLSADKKTLLMVDMNRADGITYVGVAVRVDTSVTAAAVSGKGFILSWLIAQNGGAAFSTELNATATFVSLEADGDYKLYDLDTWTEGKTDEFIQRGFWSVAEGILILDQDKSEDYIRLALLQGGEGALLITRGPAASPDATLGLGVRTTVRLPAPTSPQHYLSVTALDPNGRPVVYELGTDGVWRSTDLLSKPGGPQLLETPVSWIDQKDFKLYAAGISDVGLILYTQDYEGAWTYRNLTTEIASSEIIGSQLQVLIETTKNATLVGLSANGEILRYYQDGQKIDDGADYRFLYTNISDTDLTPNSVATPAFVGDLISYVTSWNGLNVAGLDADGNIWSVWWAPGLTAWSVSNLSEITGAAKLSSSLTAYLTSWNGINIAGLDADSQLQVVWWVPQFEGTWAQSNLSTDTIGGTAVRFRAGSVSSYVSSWDGLNIAGIDDVTGKTQVFWWAPARVNDGWAITSLSDAVPAGSPAIVRDTTGQVGLDNSLNVFGYNSASQLIRYYWLPGGEWAATNLTTTATPR